MTCGTCHNIIHLPLFYAKLFILSDTFTKCVFLLFYLSSRNDFEMEEIINLMKKRSPPITTTYFILSSSKVEVYESVRIERIGVSIEVGDSIA